MLVTKRLSIGSWNGMKLVSCSPNLSPSISAYLVILSITDGGPVFPKDYSAFGLTKRNFAQLLPSTRSVEDGSKEKCERNGWEIDDWKRDGRFE